MIENLHRQRLSFSCFSVFLTISIFVYVNRKSQPESSRGVLSKRTKRGSTVNAKINNKETSFEKKKPSE